MTSEHRITVTIEKPLVPAKWTCTCGARGYGWESHRAHLNERDNDMDWIVATDGAPTKEPTDDR
jgi:hypothetical protein